MQFIEISWQSEEYRAELELRDRLLRIPLGLSLSAEPQEMEASQWHFGLLDGKRLIACVVAVPLTDTLAKIRQMVVETEYQRQGIGSNLMRATEGALLAAGIWTIQLNAREPVIGFYERLGYQAEGERFLEVTIRHQKMVKSLPKE